MEIDLTKLSNEDLTLLLDRIGKERTRRIKIKQGTFVDNFCLAMAELVQNVPDATLLCSLDEDVIKDGEIDFLSAPIPINYQAYSTKELANFIKRSIEVK